MSKHIAFLGAAAAVLAASVLPAAAADYYGGGEGPLAFHSRDDVDIDGGRAGIEHRGGLRPAYGERRGPGPVVFDERAGYRDGYGGPGYGRPVPAGRYGEDLPPAFVPPAGRPYGYGVPYGYGDGYRPAAVAVGPAFDGPDEGCTIERARSITPAGWEKTVTHRTCYRR